MFSQRAVIIKVNDNRITTERIIKTSENNITTKFGNYAISPTHGLPNIRDRTIWYFVNEDLVTCFNPSTLEKDFAKIFKNCENYTLFYSSLIDVIRKMQYDDKLKANIEEYMKTIVKIIYDFEPDKRIDSDNIRIVPSTQKNIMENEVAKGLSARSRPQKWMVLLYIGFGLLPGVLFGIWLGGDVYNQQKYIDNYNQPDAGNETVVIQAGYGLSENVGFAVDIPFDNVFNYIDQRLSV